MIHYLEEQTFFSANIVCLAQMVPDRVVLDRAHSISSIRKIWMEYIRPSTLLIRLFNLGQDRTGGQVGFQLRLDE